MLFLQLLVTIILIFGCNAIIHLNQPILHQSRPIVGGKDARITDFPHQVSLQTKKLVMGVAEQYEYNHFCGGSIISVEWVLTAAHCTEKMRNKNFQAFRVRVGSSLKIEGGNLHEVTMCIIHPEYRGSENDYNYDISLLKVKPLFELGPTIQSVKLNNHPIETGGIVTVIGWGRTSKGGDRPLKLQKVQVPILPQWECRQIYDDVIITENMFCAGRAGRSACHGDSGGPVLYNGVQIGISSFTRSCQRPDYPVVYANVYSLRDWIHENSGV